MSNNPNAPVGLRLKQRSVLSFNTPGGMSRAMSQMRVLGTPGAQGPASQCTLSQDPGLGGAGPSQPMGSGDGAQLPAPPGMMSQGAGMMSQGMPMFTPDFITPADAQFACNYEAHEKENKGPRSPAHLSPMRSKRPRFGFDPSQLSQDSQMGSQQMSSQPVGGWGGNSQGMNMNDNGFAALRGENSGGGDDAVFRVPAPRAPSGGRAPLPRAAQSPPCLRNPFLGSHEQPDETPAHLRANGASAAALATMSRLRADFVDCGIVGRGGFCKVFKVISRLDGSMYAVKRTERKLQTERERREALKEVQAMAGLGNGSGNGHEHVVRYFGCWMEYDHLYIQLELCETTLSSLFCRWIETGGEAGAAAGGGMETDGGTDDGSAEVPERSGERNAAPFGEGEIKKVLRHVASALALAHARNVAHLDVKPDNILVKNGLYKLADWGRAAPVDGIGFLGDASVPSAGKQITSVSVEEGDSRYLAPELLRGDWSPYDLRKAQKNVTSPYTSAQNVVPESPVTTGHADSFDDDEKTSWFVGLDRADVFSLGATAYELVSGAPLQSSGHVYQALRNGDVNGTAGVFETGNSDALSFSVEFKNLILAMVSADPGKRPSSVAVLREVRAIESSSNDDAATPFRSRMDQSVGGVIGLFSPAVPDSTNPKNFGGNRTSGTPSRLGFGSTGR